MLKGSSCLSLLFFVLPIPLSAPFRPPVHSAVCFPVILFQSSPSQGTVRKDVQFQKAVSQFFYNFRKQSVNSSTTLESSQSVFLLLCFPAKSLGFAILGEIFEYVR